MHRDDNDHRLMGELEIQGAAMFGGTVTFARRYISGLYSIQSLASSPLLSMLFFAYWIHSERYDLTVEDVHKANAKTLKNWQLTIARREHGVKPRAATARSARAMNKMDDEEFDVHLLLDPAPVTKARSKVLKDAVTEE
jgi:hypothetical protein